MFPNPNNVFKKPRNPSRKSKFKTFSLKSFDLGKKIGEGKFGHVYIAREKVSKYIVALKVISKRQILKEKQERQTRREIEIHSRLNHKNILKLVGWFHDAKYLYLITEYAFKGELYKLLKKKKKFSEQVASRYIKQITEAILYLHKNNIIHRDIKPENILLDHRGNVKVCDFGWAVFSPNQNPRLTLCGTPDYLAPEMVEKRTHNYTIDMWCMGVLLYEFLVGEPPFAEEHLKMTYRRISKLDFKLPKGLSKEAQDLISKLLVKNDVERFTAEQVLKHPFITKY